MEKMIAQILEGMALRIEERPYMALIIDSMEKGDDMLLSTFVDTLVQRFGVSIDGMKILSGGMISVDMDGGEVIADVRSMPVQKGKENIVVRTLQGIMTKHMKDGYFLIAFLYPLPYGESGEVESTITEKLTKKGTLYRRPVFVMGRRGILYAVVPGEAGEVMTVSEEQMIPANEEKREEEPQDPEGVSEKKEEGKGEGVEDLVHKPGLLYFKSGDVSPENIMDALQHEGAILSDIIRKRTEAVRILGQKGLSVVPPSDIATHRLYIADLSGGFGDFMAEVSRLKAEGLWDESVKEVVKAFLKEYERLGISRDTINEFANKHGIDVFA